MGDGEGEGSPGGFGDGVGFGGLGGDAGFGGVTGAEGAGFGDAGFGDMGGFAVGDLGSDGGLSALGALGQQTDLSDALAAFGEEGLQGLNEGIIGSFPSMTTSNLSFLQDISKYSKVAQAFLGLLGKNNVGVNAMASNPVTAALAGKAAPQAMANMGINMGLSALGPIGAIAAAVNGMTGLSNGITAGLNGTNTPSSFQGNEGNTGMMDLLGGLGGMYAGYQGQKEMGNMLGGLQSLYSQNSPYAQAMRQQLARRDAAGGRRSQYGPREVELQAKLAQMASNQIPAMGQLAQNKAIARNNMLMSGLGLANKSGAIDWLRNSMFGGGLYDRSASALVDSGSLSNLFSGGQPGFGSLPMDVGYNIELPDWGG